MGDINFVNNPDKKTAGKNKQNNISEIKWTKPSVESEFFVTEKKNQKLVAEKEIKNNQVKIANIIKEKKISQKKLENKFGFINFFTGLFKGKKIEDKENLFKKEKNILAEQGENINKEKFARTNVDKNMVNDDKFVSMSKKEKLTNNRINYSEAKKLSIREAIKMKLKLDSSGRGGSNTIKTNLIKDEITTYIDWRKKVTDLVLNILVSIIIIGIAYGGLMYREHRAIMQEQGIDTKIKSLSKQLDESMQNIKEIDVFQKKLTLVADIINQHVYWTNFFKFIENTILDEVTYSGSFSGSPGNSYAFSATADSFQTVENQVRVLRANKLVKSVSVQSVSLQASDETTGINIPTVNFSISFEVNDDLFNINPEKFNDYFLD